MSTSSWPKYKFSDDNSGRKSVALTTDALSSSFTNWILSTSVLAIFSSPILLPDNSVVFMNGANQMCCVSSSGLIRWTYDTGVPVLSGSGASSSPLYDATLDAVYVGLTTGSLLALSSTGSLLWTSSLSAAALQASPSLSVGGIYIADMDHALYRVDPATGSLRGEYRIPTVCYNMVAIDADSGTVYFINELVIALDAELAPIWNFSWASFVTPSTLSFGSPVLQGNHTLYFSTSQALYSLNLTRRVLNWLTPLDSRGTPSVGLNGTVFVCDHTSHLYAISPQGSTLWVFSAPGGHYMGTAAAVDYYGNVYAGMETLYALTPAGSLLWSYSICGDRNLSDGYTHSSPALGNYGYVYVGSTSGALYALSAAVALVLGNRSCAAVVSSAVPVAYSLDTYLEIIVPVAAVLLALIVVLYTQRRAGPAGEGSDKRDEIEYSDNPFYWPTESGSSGPSGKSRRSLLVDGSASLSGALRPVRWDELRLSPLLVPTEALLGFGSFGAVLQAELTSSVAGPFEAADLTGPWLPVAVKVLTRSSAAGANAAVTDFASVCRRAVSEAQLMTLVRSRLLCARCIVPVLGVASGPLPGAFAALFHLAAAEPAVGIVMGLQRGGCLKDLLQQGALHMREKLRLLAELAHCIAELHATGTVHGDLKPANVLLSDKIQPRVCLADFGLSKVFEHTDDLQASSLQHTRHGRGTPIYCAPEMLVNPFSESFDESVARASRKTDMYAFGLLAWQVLSQATPFPDVKSESALCAQVHAGRRPPLDLLPADLPSGLPELLTACWSGDRAVRPTAVDCMAVFRRALFSFTGAPVTIFLALDCVVDPDTHTALIHARLSVLHYLVSKGAAASLVAGPEDLSTLHDTCSDISTGEHLLLFSGGEAEQSTEGNYFETWRHRFPTGQVFRLVCRKAPFEAGSSKHSIPIVGCDMLTDSVEMTAIDLTVWAQGSELEEDQNFAFSEVSVNLHKAAGSDLPTSAENSMTLPRRLGPSHLASLAAPLAPLLHLLADRGVIDKAY